MAHTVNWMEAPAEQTVCYCNNINKEQIVMAIARGAQTVDDITMITGAGGGNECATKHPEGRCCKEDIQSILDTYLPALNAMQGCAT